MIIAMLQYLFLCQLLHTDMDLSGTVTTSPAACAGYPLGFIFYILFFYFFIFYFFLIFSTKNSGSIFVLATGSFAPYTYELNDGAFSASPSFDNLAPGRYYATIKDNQGCIFTVTDIIVPQLPSMFSLSTPSLLFSHLFAHYADFSISTFWSCQYAGTHVCGRDGW
jgi:hypothetical protein